MSVIEHLRDCRCSFHEASLLYGLPAGSALQNRLASLDPTADAVPPLMVPRVAQVLGGQLPAGFPVFPM